MKTSPKLVSIDGKLLKFTNLEKVLFPEPGFTKGDVIRYYRQIAPYVLPHLRDRPFTLKRYPDGVEAGAFYEKKCPSHRPPWVQTGWLGDVHHCLINDVPTLLWAANLAAIELHTVLATTRNLESPNFVAFDLDPGPGIGMKECCEIALVIRKLFDRHRIEAFPKTSGSKGLHLYVPLNSPSSYEQSKGFARAIAEILENQLPDQVVSKMAKKLRDGKVFIDWSQNVDFKTTTTVYSLRAKALPGVSTPIEWQDVERAAKRATAAAKLLEFTPESVLRRCAKSGDLFAPVLTLKQKLPRLEAPRFRIRSAA